MGRPGRQRPGGCGADRQAALSARAVRREGTCQGAAFPVRKTDRRPGQGGKAYRQGGNLPFYRRLPFMRGQGFTPLNRATYNEVNLDQLAAAFKAEAEVTPETLGQAHLLRDPKNPIVILGRGDVSVGLKVRAHRVTAGAKTKIEKAGGSVELIGS